RRFRHAHPVPVRSVQSGGDRTLRQGPCYPPNRTRPAAESGLRPRTSRFGEPFADGSRGLPAGRGSAAGIPLMGNLLGRGTKPANPARLPWPAAPGFATGPAPHGGAGPAGRPGGPRRNQPPSETGRPGRKSARPSDHGRRRLIGCARDGSRKASGRRRRRGEGIVPGNGKRSCLGSLPHSRQRPADRRYARPSDRPPEPPRPGDQGRDPAQSLERKTPRLFIFPKRGPGIELVPPEGVESAYAYGNRKTGMEDILVIHIAGRLRSRGPVPGSCLPTFDGIRNRSRAGGSLHPTAPEGGNLF